MLPVPLRTFDYGSDGNADQSKFDDRIVKVTEVFGQPCTGPMANISPVHMKQALRVPTQLRVLSRLGKFVNHLPNVMVPYHRPRSLSPRSSSPARSSQGPVLTRSFQFATNYTDSPLLPAYQQRWKTQRKHAADFHTCVPRKIIGTLTLSISNSKYL
jgi:hypothetical protein